MKIALAALGFITDDIEFNKKRIISTLKELSGKADLIVFGESYLQGFECLTWVYDEDRNISISRDSKIIDEIKTACNKYRIAVSFGYIEKDGDKLFSSQITVSEGGKILNNFRRISTGWKEKEADAHYCEGDEFIVFKYKGKTFSIGLCGDLWYEDNCKEIKKLGTDIVLWPVYTDFNYIEWNNKIKYEYLEQSKKCGEKILFVNSYCLDRRSDEIARGGAIYFKDGIISDEIEAGKEAILVIEI